MSYISDLRKVIGHDVIMTVGCGVVIENDQGEILLQKRSDTGEWCIPGGAMELYETYEEAAIREVREEVGIEAKNLRLFGLYSGNERVIHYPNRDIVYPLAVIFITNKYSGEISDTDSEVEEHRFFKKEKLPENLFAPDCRIIKDWSEGSYRKEIILC